MNLDKERFLDTITPSIKKKLIYFTTLKLETFLKRHCDYSEKTGHGVGEDTCSTYNL